MNILYNLKEFFYLFFTGVLLVFYILHFIALCFRVNRNVCKMNEYVMCNEHQYIFCYFTDLFFTV